jgi:hypothetical protein
MGYDEASGLGSINIAAFDARALAAQPRVVSVGVGLPGGQRPVQDRQILVTVSCSNGCLIGAHAVVAVGRSTRFEVDSPVYRLRTAGEKSIALRPSAAALGRLHAALAAHQRVTATVQGVLFDSITYGVLANPDDSVRALTSAKRLTITR